MPYRRYARLRRICDLRSTVARMAHRPRAAQGPGEFVVTFPCAYHGGFNMGLNCAEAVNFAPPDWLRFGGPSVERFRSFRKQPVLSHAWLLLQVRCSLIAKAIRVHHRVYSHICHAQLKRPPGLLDRPCGNQLAPIAGCRQQTKERNGILGREGLAEGCRRGDGVAAEAAADR